MPEDFHGGRLIARRLAAHGVTRVFTRPRDDITTILTGCAAEGIEVVDVRHEQSAIFAAAGWAQVTRTLGVCVVGAGAGVTNAMSAIASARESETPVLVLAGRPPAATWGPGPPQGLDHLPFVTPLAKFAGTASSTAAIPDCVEDAIISALSPRSGPVFLDVPLERLLAAAPDPFTSWSVVRAPAMGTEAGQGGGLRSGPGPALADISAAVALLSQARRPVILAGSGLYWGHGEHVLADLAERLGIPVFLEGLARGSLGAGHPLELSRVRARALAQADVGVLIGMAPRARLGCDAELGRLCELIAVDVAAPRLPASRSPMVSLYGDLHLTLSGLERAVVAADAGWMLGLRDAENAARTAEATELRTAPDPRNVLRALAGQFRRDALVIADGEDDLVTSAARLIDVSAPGAWLDPGPFGCLGAGPSYALAATLARPGGQVVLLQDAAAFAVSGMDWEACVRHGAAVVSVQFSDGTSESRPERVVAALGGHGEWVREPGELRGAFERAVSAGGPALINVLAAAQNGPEPLLGRSGSGSRLAQTGRAGVRASKGRG